MSDFPPFLHADGMKYQYQTRDSLMVYHIHPLCCFPQVSHHSYHLGRALGLAALEFEHLAKSVHPVKDFWGKSLQKASLRDPLQATAHKVTQMGF